MSHTNTLQRLEISSNHPKSRQPVAMKKDALLSIDRPLGMRIECLQGILWITQDSDPRDLILFPGEHLVVDRGPRVIVQALETGLVRIAGIAA